MTPAIDLLKKNNIEFTIHQYDHDPSSSSYGEEAVEKLGVEPEQIFKTLVAECSSGEFAVAVIPVNSKLNLKALAKHCDCKKVVMADKLKASKITGYLLGGVSPLAQKTKLPSYIHKSVVDFSSIFISGGKRGLDIELSPISLLNLCNASLVDIATGK